MISEFLIDKLTSSQFSRETHNCFRSEVNWFLINVLIFVPLDNKAESHYSRSFLQSPSKSHKVRKLALSKKIELFFILDLFFPGWTSSAGLMLYLQRDKTLESSHEQVFII